MEFEKRPTTRVSTALAIAGTTLYVKDSTYFGSSYLTPPFLIVIDPDSTKREFCLVTAVDTVANTMTIERDIFGTTDVAHGVGALVQECGYKDTLMATIADISTAETLYLPAPECVVKKITTVLGGTISVANATVTAYKNATAMTGGAITIGYDGSAAGDIDAVYPTANTELAETDYIKLVGDGGSTTAAILQIMIEVIRV